jgi:hypothetical protein
VSVPFNLSVLKADLQVRWNGSVYSWAEAVSLGRVLNFMYEWNRSTQSYGLTDVLVPGCGYWMYAYQSCSVFVISAVVPADSEVITVLSTQWNFVGISDEVSVEKNILIVSYDGVDYNWTAATTSQNPTGSPLILAFIYNWDRNNQSYMLSDSLIPGYAYWMYAYQVCQLKKGGI